MSLAGPFDSERGPRLYTWDGTSPPKLDPGDQLRGSNPEGSFAPEGASDVLVLSDDGSLLVDGTECKRLKDPSKKRFRGRWITP